MAEMKRDGRITINGKPLEEHLDNELTRELTTHMATENTGRGGSRFVTPKSKYRWNRSGARSSQGVVVWHSGQKATHVILGRDVVVDWKSKAPFERSGESIFGGIELSQETDEVRCHECGEWISGTLQYHIKIHRINWSEYKYEHGLGTMPSTAPRKRNQLKEECSQRLQIARERRSKEPIDTTKCRAGLAKRATVIRSLAVRPSFRATKENLLGKCRAQSQRDLILFAKHLGRPPLSEELEQYTNREGQRNLRVCRLRLLFGMPVGKLFKVLGIGSSHSNSRRTHCAKGHEFTKGNTLVTKHGHRKCKACQAEWYRKWKMKREEVYA